MDPHEELLDLQNRFHLLEGDRKAFYEQSQLTLKQNKEICDELRRENKELFFGNGRQIRLTSAVMAHNLRCAMRGEHHKCIHKNMIIAEVNGVSGNSPEHDVISSSNEHVGFFFNVALGTSDPPSYSPGPTERETKSTTNIQNLKDT